MYVLKSIHLKHYYTYILIIVIYFNKDSNMYFDNYYFFQSKYIFVEYLSIRQLRV